MKALITGGAGFIGSNAVRRYIDQGWDVVVVDDLSRPGSEKNLAWLQREGKHTFRKCDIRDPRQVADVFPRAPRPRRGHPPARLRSR